MATRPDRRARSLTRSLRSGWRRLDRALPLLAKVGIPIVLIATAASLAVGSALVRDLREHFTRGYEAQADSIGTRWMLDQLKPGMRINAKGPAGIFTLPTRAKKKYLFLSAGSSGFFFSGRFVSRRRPAACLIYFICRIKELPD
jgi:hypothetical protein